MRLAEPIATERANDLRPSRPSDRPPTGATAGDRDRPGVAGPARLLAELGAQPGSAGPTSLAHHRRRYPAPPPPRRSGQAQLIDLVERSGLSGRGGAAFSTGDKLRVVASGHGPAVVVVNGAEGEPASGKDRLLLCRLPHLVLDGALVAAAAVGADRVVVCIDRTNTSALASVKHAVGERAAQGDGALPIDVAATPPRYVAGESSALVQWLNDGPAKPTAPPRPGQRGVAGRPTLVHNTETLAHLAQIACFGPEWFRQVGTASEAGTVLLTVSGAVARPSIIETALGTPIERILAQAGGVVGAPGALLMGGYFGTWVAAERAGRAPFSRAGLAPLGAAPGAGVVIALPEDACGLAETARLLAWYAAESAGQCGPCLYGLADLAAGAAALAQPYAQPRHQPPGPAFGSVAPRALAPGPTGGPARTSLLSRDPGGQVAQLRRWAEQIAGRGGCHHPDGAVNLLRSALRVFADDLAGHEQGRPCRGASAPPGLPIPAAQTTWR